MRIIQQQQQVMPLGEKSQPIQIPSDNEEQQMIRRKLQLEISKQQIMQALLANCPYSICFAVVKSVMQGDCFRKQELLRKECISYFLERVKLNIEHENFNEKLEANYTNEATTPNEECLILYGVDFMKTANIKKRFTAYDPQVEWVNQSKCKLTFHSSTEAREALRNNVQDLALFDIKLENQDSVFNRWFQLTPYYQIGFERRLWARYATSEETVIPKSMNQSMFFAYEDAKQAFIPWLLDRYRAREKYFEVLEKDRLSRNRRIRGGGSGRFREQRGRMKSNRSFYQQEDDWQRDHFRKSTPAQQINELNSSFAQIKDSNPQSLSLFPDKNSSFMVQEQTQTVGIDTSFTYQNQPQQKQTQPQQNEPNDSFSSLQDKKQQNEARDCSQQLSILVTKENNQEDLLNPSFEFQQGEGEELRREESMDILVVNQDEQSHQAKDQYNLQISNIDKKLDCKPSAEEACELLQD